MCTPVYSSLLLILLATLTISIMCGTKMAAVGLPLNRWERSADYDDILAGADFLSVFMESSLRGAYKDPFPTTAQPQFPSETSSIDQDRTEPYVRTSRQASSSYQDDIIAQTTDRQFISDTTSDSSSVNDGVIVAVRVSSSISNRDKTIQNNNKLYETTETTTADFFEQRILPLEEDQSSFVAKSSKSELSAEESEPVTSDSDQHQPSSEISRRSYPSSVQGLPNANFNPTSFLSQENKDKQAPFHHSFIYHDTPKLPGQARSVSYSTVIQGVSQTEKSTPIHERRERNYNNPRTPFVNSFHDLRKNETKPVLISNQNYGMSTGETNTNIKQENNWENPEVNYHESSTKLSQTTERNWEQPYTTHSQPPKVYGRPEQNYEVDEAVSVVTNGRTHGVQPSPLPSDKNKPGTGDKKDDNQKVGYVVEGRNYRKYRVEERTADGFIVGEYGVVSHDDGSLRGVRYTADGTINPRLIYDALMKFLSL